MKQESVSLNTAIQVAQRIFSERYDAWRNAIQTGYCASPSLKQDWDTFALALQAIFSLLRDNQSPQQ